MSTGFVLATCRCSEEGITFAGFIARMNYVRFRLLFWIRDVIRINVKFSSFFSSGLAEYLWPSPKFLEIFLRRKSPKTETRRKPEVVKMKLLPHQVEALKAVEGKNRCAFYHDMGLGKTEEGASKAEELNAPVNPGGLPEVEDSGGLAGRNGSFPNITHMVDFVYDLTDPDELKAGIGSLQTH